MFILEMCPVVDFAYVGKDISIFKNITSWKECSRLCRGLGNCRFWTWTESKSMCIPKSDDSGRNMIQGGKISGRGIIVRQMYKYLGTGRWQCVANDVSSAKLW